MGGGGIAAAVVHASEEATDVEEEEESGEGGKREHKERCHFCGDEWCRSLTRITSPSLTFPVCCSLERTLCFHPMPPTQPFQTPLHPPTSSKHTTWGLTRSPPHHRCRAVRTVACLHSCSAGSAWSCSSATHLRVMTLATQGHVTVRHIALL